MPNANAPNHSFISSVILGMEAVHMDFFFFFLSKVEIELNKNEVQD